MSSLFTPYHMLLFMLSCQINIRNNFYFSETRRDLRIRGVPRKEELFTQYFSEMRRDLRVRDVLRKDRYFFKINHIYLNIKKEIQLYQCKINSKLLSSLFSNYINFKIIYFLNQNNTSFFYFAISTQPKVPEDTISTHPTYVVSRVIFGAINDYASIINTFTLP